MIAIEEVKAHKDGLDVVEDLYRYARDGAASLPPEEEALLRWYGIYTQRPAEDGYYMVRTRIPGGELTAAQLRALAGISRDYGRGLADVTVRQNVQFHWVRLGDLPDVLDRVRAAALSTTEACGDCVRNIVNCPVAGVADDELYDASPLVAAINEHFVDNRDFSNLPRKFKIAVTGCALRCVYPEINDIGLFAVRDGEGVAFRARVGGGLSTSPRFSKDLGVLVDPSEVVELCAAIASVFRDEGDRTNRKRARLKFLVEAWEVPRFRDAVEARLGRRLRRAREPAAEPVSTVDRTHLGYHAQREPGLVFAGVPLVGGRTSADELDWFADLAESHGSGRVRTTTGQNLVLLDVREDEVPTLEARLSLNGRSARPHWAERAVIACTGIQFCKLAVSETKSRADGLVAYLREHVQLDEPVRISVTGCPNSCGQHHICDIGLEGAVTRMEGERREAFQVFLGGGVGEYEAFGRRTGVRIPSERLAETLAAFLLWFKATRREGESFQSFCRRHDDATLATMLSDAVVSARG
jgi:ferredoxin-nitrite reductase